MLKNTFLRVMLYIIRLKSNLYYGYLREDTLVKKRVVSLYILIYSSADYKYWLRKSITKVETNESQLNLNKLSVSSQRIRDVFFLKLRIPV